jgi:hypothetical protein
LDTLSLNFLSSIERLELERCVRRQHEDHGIACRANAILLLDKGKSCAEIADKEKQAAFIALYERSDCR